MNKLIDAYFAAKAAVQQNFGYKGDWVEIPMEDERSSYWAITDTHVYYFDKPFTKEIAEKGEFYSGTIYYQRFLPKWVYPTDTHTMVCVDTHTDGNKFLMIFDNSKECKDEAIKATLTQFWSTFSLT